ANEDVSLRITPGEVHALLGQNGAGKSTLVGILTGHVTPEAGRVELGEEPLELGNPKDSQRLGLVAVYQNLMLVPALTGLENIALALGAAPNRRTLAQLRAVQTDYDIQ